MGVLLKHSGLRILHCQCWGLCHGGGMNSIHGLGTSTCYGGSQKKKKKEKKEKRKNKLGTKEEGQVRRARVQNRLQMPLKNMKMSVLTLKDLAG